MTAAISIEGLTKRYGGFVALSDLTLDIEPGEIFALLGPNGAGKTTTIRMLIGVLRASSGRASVHGYDCFSNRAEVMRRLGYLPDEPQFYDYLRGSEILRFVAGMHGLDPAVAQERAAQWTERFELVDALDEFAANYSKGMKKKLALTCALLHEPEVLVLDEPTNGLDPFATRSLQDVLRELAEGPRRTAIFYSTHLLEQAERLCQRAGILRAGELVACDTVALLRDSLAAGGTLEDVFFEVSADVSEDRLEPESGHPDS